MAPAGARAVLIILVAAAFALQLAAAPVSAGSDNTAAAPVPAGEDNTAAAPEPAGSDNTAAVAEVCKKTPFPELCTGSTQKHVGKYDDVDQRAVLQMQLDAFKKRLRAASKRIEKAAKTAATPALNRCKELYLDADTNASTCKRAMGFDNGDLILGSLGVAVGDVQKCDEEFKKAAAKNPVSDLNKSLVDMTTNCQALTKMIFPGAGTRQ